MPIIRRLVRVFVRSVEGWGRSGDRERIVDVRSTGPCPRCGEERIRARDVRTDDLGYSVRIRERWSCGCDDDPARESWPRDPAGVA